VSSTPSRVDHFKLLPLRLGITRVAVGWRLLFSAAVMAGYMVVSRDIYWSEGLTFADIELRRTPFRLGAALLYWLLMADVMFGRQPNTQALRSPGVIVGLALAFMASLLVFAEPSSRIDALVIAAATIPVALNEEFFFRGILQTLLMRQVGALQGIVLVTIFFILFHVDTGQDAISFLLIGMAGLILSSVYFKTGSMTAAVVIHAIYDALASVLEVPFLSRAWGIVFLLGACVLILRWANART
jgi:membrane protease YdiL (CAAX protease family)